MLDVVFLGTGGSPRGFRRLISTFVKWRDAKFLIDCADGTQYSFLRHAGTLSGLLRVLITHEHLDHLIGFGGLIHTLDLVAPDLSVEVYAGEAAIPRIRTLLKMADIRKGHKVRVEPLGAKPLVDDESFRCSAFRIDHTDSSYGFVLEEKERSHIRASELERLGIPRGELRSRLAAGESVVLPDGQIVTPAMVLAAPQEGAKLVYVGDTDYDAALTAYCRRADCLIMEATYLESERTLARQYKHLTAREAASIARQSEAAILYLNHLSPRYHDPAILDEALAVFPRTRVAHDLYRIRVPERDATGHVEGTR